MNKNTDRFTFTYKQGKLEGVQIMVDNETGVNYLVYFSGYGSSVTPLHIPQELRIRSRGTERHSASN